MRIRILDRVLVALAGLLLLALCAGIVAQVFFGQDVTGMAAKLAAPETVAGKVILGAAIALLLLIGLYCLLMMFRHRRRKDKFILQKLESGDLAISLKTLESMVQKCVEQHNEIKTESIHLENQRDGLLVRIRGTVAGGISIPLTVDTLQKQVKQYVTACSGVEVKGIRIQIESSGADAKDARFAIEPPACSLLPRGSETAPEPEEPVPVPAEPAEAPAEPAPEVPAESEKVSAAEEAAAAAVLAAAENMMDGLEPEDDRPFHQRLFSTQEEPCIMPMPPENIAAAAAEAEETAEAAAAEEEEKPGEAAAEPEEGNTGAADEPKGEENA